MGGGGGGLLKEVEVQEMEKMTFRGFSLYQKKKKDRTEEKQERTKDIWSDVNCIDCIT